MTADPSTADAPATPAESRLRRLAKAGVACALFGIFGTFAFAPYGLFPLAYLALVPLLWITANSTSRKSAFAGGFVAGLCFFGGSLWYIVELGIFPVIGLCVYLALYPAVFCVLWRPFAGANRALPVLLATLAAATFWTGLEWLRGVLFTGLPYVLLGHTQTPLLAGIQVADVVGAYGVTFWVALLGSTLWAVVRHRRVAWLSAAATVAVLASVFSYGTYRLSEAEQTVAAGPSVLLLQPNMPMQNSGGFDSARYVLWHVKATSDALAADGDVDLVVWPESVTPAINPESRSTYTDYPRLLTGELITLSHEALKQASQGRTVIAGGSFGQEYVPRTADNGLAYPHPSDRRNSVYEYRDGQQTGGRYDKSHLVPYGEYMPFRDWPAPIGWLYPVFQVFHPWGGEEWELTAGQEVTLFDIASAGGQEYRAITPICFEDIVPERVRLMAYGDRFGGGGKRADLLINVTNDGWFRGPQMEQHLQAARFRSVEVRLPSARAVNTGVSAVIGPSGEVVAKLSAAVDGTLRATMPVDSRSSPYGTIGDLFAQSCFALAVVHLILQLAAGVRKRVQARKPRHD